MNEGLYHVLVLSILLCPIYSQNVKNSSLIFVIDNTISMSAEVKNVLRSADGVFDAVYNSNKSEIENVIIVTFNDPDFELRIKTNKREDFKESLRTLHIGGGGDCPEMAMSGIELGLQSGGPYSYMFVFTDARAKDINKYERVKNLALELNTKITFLVTKMYCTSEPHMDFSAFVKLAYETGGEFFFLNKNNIPYIMKYVMKLVDSRKVEIMQKQFNATDEKKVVVPIDPSIDNVIMSVNGGASKVQVTDKDNTTVNTQAITDVKNLKIISWNNTNPGDYTIDVNSTTNTLLTMHGSTKVSFSYGFSVIKPNNFNETANRPVADQKSYILLKLNTEGDRINLRRLDIVDLKNNVLLDKLKFVAEEDQYYVSDPIDFPKDTFKIVMVAEDEKMKDIITRASLPIEPQKVLPDTIKNEAPTVTILGQTKVTTSVGNPLQLKCRATGYPKPEILWYDAFGRTLTSTVSTVREEYELISVLSIEKVEKSSTYICKASNIINNDEKSVEVETGDRFTAVRISKDKQIEYNKEENIYCKVNADPPAKVIWYLNGNEIKADDDFDISPDTSTLTIKKMKPNYKGTVLCEVRNGVKRLMYSIKLSLAKSAVEGPKIDKRITEIFVTRGSNAIVSCRILKGTPKPVIKWSFKSKNNDSFHDMKEYKEDIPIESVSNNDAGTYKCVATNEIAEDSHVLELIINYAPVVEGQNNVTIIQETGRYILVTCDIKGEPAPTINWFFNGLMILNLEPYQIDNHNTLSFEASVDNMGQYSCEGVNKLGSVKKIANINVFEKPRLTKNSSVETKNIEFGEPLNLICPVKGYPTPKIQWSFVSFDGNPRNVRNISSNGQIQIPEATMNDDGYYTCIVYDYDSEIKYLFEVNVKKSIKRTPKKIEAVEGDKYLKIPCKRAAELNSTITWYKNDAPIIIGNEWHSMDSDGSLIIKKVRNTIAGIYNCMAQDFSKVLETFQVNVAKYPNLRQGYTIEYFLEDKNATVQCKAAQPTTDIRWYKVYKTKYLAGFDKSLTWNPYKNNLSGKYVCRVDNGFQYKNDGVDVKTGSIPKFQFDTNSQVDNVPFDQEAYLTCVHIALPKTEILWWKNDIRMNYDDMTYSVQNRVSDQGKYKCLAKNKFGNISREFIVTANDCLLNIEKDFDRYRPLILTNTFKLPDFFIKDRHLAIPIGTTVQFFCNATFNKFPQRTVKATCREGTTFEINKELVDYRTLKCKEALQIVTNPMESTERCKGTLYQIGIQSVFDFIELYKICSDGTRRSLYTEHILRPWAAGVKAASMLEEKWFHSDMLSYNQNEIYDCKRQSDNISVVLGRSLSGNEDECYIPTQLINEKDVPPGFPQLLTYSYLNVVPHWNSDAARYWKIIEKKIRKNAKKRIEKRNIIVTTGVNYDVLRGQPQINITDEAGNSIKVPTFLWKVISDTYTSSSVVIVQINVPPSLIDNIATYQVCISKCDEIPWITGEIDEKYLKSGFMLCCDITQFEKIFQFTNLSQGRTWLLRTFEN